MEPFKFGGEEWVSVDDAAARTGKSRGWLLGESSPVEKLTREVVEERGITWPLTRKAKYLLKVADLPQPSVDATRVAPAAVGVAAVLADQLEAAQEQERVREHRREELMETVGDASELLDDIDRRIDDLLTQRRTAAIHLGRALAELKGLTTGAPSAAGALSSAQALLTELLIPDR